jgi:hypothetical protein
VRSSGTSSSTTRTVLTIYLFRLLSPRQRWPGPRTRVPSATRQALRT